MTVDFDIIDKSCNLIDRYSLGWLIRYYDVSFISNHYKQSINSIIQYCDEEIIKLTNKINKFEKILDCLNEQNFQKRKILKINLISNIDDENDFYSTLEYFTEYHMDEYNNTLQLNNNSKLMSDFEYVSLHILHFKNFENFLVKYKEYNYEITF
jgi:hypothetical protein